MMPLVVDGHVAGGTGETAVAQKIVRVGFLGIN